MNSFKIGDFSIGLRHAPFIIAEMSGNHNQSLDQALKIVESAYAGAHALKLQTTTMTLDIKTFIKDNVLWKGNSLYDLYKIAHTPWDGTAHNG